MELAATPEDVRHAYRLLLGREPDDTGLAHFRRLLDESPISAFRLADTFLRSDEFKARRGGQMPAKEIAFDGYVLYVNPADLHIGKTIAAGRYEPHVTQVVREQLHAGDTFVDIGANIGYFTALSAAIVGPRGRVVAVEPMDKNTQLIFRTIEQNDFRNVEVYQCAASDQRRIVPMVTADGTSNAEIAGRDARGRATAYAQAWRLDDLFRGIDRIDVLKFDVEGHEMSAWNGFRECISRTGPMVLTEFHPKCLRENAGIEPEDYLALLFEYASSLEVLVDTNRRISCRTADDVMREWNAADRRLNSGGTTHLDLFLRPR